MQFAQYQNRKTSENSIYFTEATTITPLDMASAEELKDQGNKAFALKEYKRQLKYIEMLYK